MAINFDLVTPEELLYSSTPAEVVIPGQQGDFGVLEHHSPLISNLKTGVVDVHESGSKIRKFYVFGGFAEVTENRCTVLAEFAQDLSEFSVSNAKEQLQQAEHALENIGLHENKDLLQRNVEIAKGLVEAFDTKR